jgi:hypothetical protein
MISNDNLQLVKLELELNEVELPSPGDTFEQLVNVLATHIDHLIVHDFHRLISLLYRLDISEERLRYYLDQTKDLAAGRLIAEMIIERQLQKIEARKSFKKDDDIPEEDKW